MFKREFKSFLEGIELHFGIKLDKETIENTPERVSRMYLKELLIGYSQSPTEILSKRFAANQNDMVIVKKVPFVSLCAHHILPFIGTAYFGYIPNNEVVGLSKIPRLIECHARRLQIQENMTSDIATDFFNIVKPQGCIVITKAQHLCAQIRGVQSHNTEMTCSSIRGTFENKDVREEFLSLIKE